MNTRICFFRKRVGFQVLIDRNQPEDKRLLVETYTALGQYTNAQTRLNQVNGTDEETSSFVTLYSTLINAGLAGRNVYHMNAADWSNLSGLISSGTQAGTSVRNLDYVLKGRYHPLVAAHPVKNRTNPSDQANISGNSTVLAYPNPFDESVTLQAPNDEIVAVKIFDIRGKLLLSERMNQAIPTYTWKLENKASGVYFCLIETATGHFVSGKFISQSK